MEEKIYHFTESRGIDNQKQIFVKESELSKSQKELLLGEAIHRFKDLMPELKEQFLSYILKCDCGRSVGVGKCNVCDNDE